MLSKKNFILVLILILAILSCSCSDNRPSYGNVDSGKGNDQTVQDIGQNIFTGTENTFDYEFKKLNLGRGKLSIPYPSHWNVDVVSDYLICFTAPDNDPLFPNQKIYLHSDLTVYPWLESFLQIFDILELDRSLETYSFLDSSIIPYYVDPHLQISKWYVDDDVCKAEEQCFGYGTAENIIMYNGGTLPTSKLNVNYAVTTFFWQNIPFSLNTVVEQNKTDRIIELEKYMSSNITFLKPTVGTQEIINPFNNDSLSVSLPKALAEINSQSEGFEKSKVYMCDALSLSPLSQTSVSFYKIKTSEFDGLDDTTFSYNYINTFTRNALNNWSLDFSSLEGAIIPNEKSVTIAGIKATEYTGDTYIYTDGIDDNATIRNGLCLSNTVYEFEKNDYTYIIIVSAPQSNFEVQEDIKSLILKTAKF